MWSCSRKIQYPGVKENSDGTIEFSLTEEESREADLALKTFTGYVVHPAAAGKICTGTIAVALNQYAKDLVVQHYNDIRDVELKSNRISIREILKKAIAAVWKSYSLWPLPVFLYHRATYLRLLGNKGEAIRLMNQFLEKQKKLKTDKVENVLATWEGTNIALAIAVAQKWGH